MSQITEQAVLDSLSQIIDPDLKKDIVTLGFVRDLKIDGGDVSFRIVLTTPACPVKEEMEGMAREFVRVLPGVTDVNVTMDAEVPQGRGIANSVAVEGDDSSLHIVNAEEALKNIVGATPLETG